MATKGFDIESLLEFQPPSFFCQKCYGITTRDHIFTFPEAENGRACPVCGIVYLPTDQYPRWEMDSYLTDTGFKIQFDDVMAHSRTIARIAHSARRSLDASKNDLHPPPLRILFEAFYHAQQFIHFTTYGISPLLVGALKLIAQKVQVRGIISNVDSYMADELTKYADESPNLSVKIFERSNKPEDWEISPHQKVIVVDGLMAFKGSANLTTQGWRKAAQGRDLIEVVTHVEEVVNLHNRLFSRIWAESDERSHIVMEREDIPF